MFYMWNKMAPASTLVCLVCVIFISSVSGQVENVTCSKPLIDSKTWNLSVFCTAIVYGEVSDGKCFWNFAIKNETKTLSYLDNPGQVHQRKEQEFLWNCSFNRQFPYTNGSYDVFIQFYGQTMPQKYAFSIDFEPPELEIPCPDYIKEGDSLNCTCRVTNRPEPSPLLSWDDKHDYREERTIFLLEENVGREQNMKSHVCYAKWSNDTVSKSYTLKVAYGPDPDQVSVEKVQLIKRNGWEEIVLRCTAVDVFPGAKLTWSVPCLNTTISTESSDCTFRLAPENNGKIVQCTATNNITNISQHASYTLTLSGDDNRETSLNVTTSLPETTKKDNSVPVLYIAVGAGCGLAVVLLCVIVICCIRRRNQGKEGVRFKGGVMRQSIKPTAVAARILQYPDGDNAAFVVDDSEDGVPSNNPVAKQAKSAIYDVLNKRQKEVKFVEESSSNFANAQDKRNEPQKETAGPTVSAVSATPISKDSEQETITRL